MWPCARWCHLAAIGLVLFPLSACAEPDQPSVSLAEGRERGPAADESGTAPFHVAIAAIISPSATLEAYGPLLDYLSAKLDQPVGLVQRTTYAEINELLRQGDVDLAFVCSGAYVEGQRQFGMELLAAPVVAGQAEYYSNVIVPRESGATGLTDLRSTTFAFSDPLSNSGHLTVQWELRRIGQDPKSFFASTIFTYSHDNSIKAVAAHLADGAAVDSLVYDFAVSREPSLGERTRVLLKLGPYGMPPVVVRPGVEPGLKARLREIFLRLGDDPASAPARSVLGIDRFSVPDERAYDSVRAMARVIRGWHEAR